MKTQGNHNITGNKSLKRENISVVLPFSNLRKQLQDEGVVFSVAQMIFVGASAIATFAAARWIKPDDLGIWRIMALTEVYTLFATLGIPNSFLRQYPIARGAGEMATSRRLTNALYWAYLMQSCFGILVVLAIVRFRLLFEPALWLSVGVLVYGVSFVAMRMKTAAEMLLRAEGRFVDLSKAYLILTVLQLVALVAVPVWGLAGYLGYWIVYTVGQWVVLESFVGSRGLFSLELPGQATFVNMMRDGLPLIAIALITVLFESLDRIWLSIYADTRSVGLYVIADSTKLFLAQLLGTIALVYYVRCGVAFGKQDRDGVRQSVVSAAKVLSVAYAVGSTAMLVAMWGVPTLFPAYASGVSAALMILAGGAGLAFASLGFLLTVMRSYRWSFAAGLCGLLMQVGAQALLAGHLSPGTMVALSWSIGQFSIAIVMTLGVLTLLKASKN